MTGANRPRARPTDDRRSSAGGQILVFFAIVIVTLLAFLALTIDGGFAFSNRRAMQNAADAGALAGARELALWAAGSPVGDQDVAGAVLAAAAGNGWDAATGTITATYLTTSRVPLGQVGSFGAVAPPASAAGLAVTATTSFNTFFGGFIGLPRLTMAAEARAIYGASCSAGCLPPFAVYLQNFVPGASYQFFGSNSGPGQFGWFSFSGPSSQDLCNDLTASTCNSGTITSGGWVPGNSGNNWPSCVVDPDKLPALVGQTVTVALFGPGPGTAPGGPGCGDGETHCSSGTCTATCGTGNNFQYHVAGFGTFQITSYNRSTKSLQGIFLNTLSDAAVTPGCLASQGVPAVNLIR